ncbi:hypothetical protein DAKH74_051030 [Maudiozyma humilis]|uniref:Uncharacterized protein n=1 Tax=Maudiozyma humilis TaxID=51915 RepID=A0AAV5S420_MAUHU|nr:hypothetical protein DAKH74_051030 [Kazachstania humilis]
MMFGLLSKRDKGAAVEGELQSRPGSAGSGAAVLTSSDESLGTCTGFLPDDADVLSASSAGSDGRMSPFMIYDSGRESGLCEERGGGEDVEGKEEESLPLPIESSNYSDARVGTDEKEEKKETSPLPPLPRTYSYSALRPWVCAAVVFCVGVLVCGAWLFVGAWAARGGDPSALAARGLGGKDAGVLCRMVVYRDWTVQASGEYSGVYLVDFDRGVAVPLDDGVGDFLLALGRNSARRTLRVSRHAAAVVSGSARRWCNRESGEQVYRWVVSHAKTATAALHLRDRASLLQDTISRGSRAVAHQFSEVIRNYSRALSP